MDPILYGYAFVAFVTVATPGPTVLLALNNGARFGFGRAGFGMAGAVLSDLVLIAAAALGLGAVLATSALAFAVLKWLGVAYLAYLGVQLLRSAGAVPAPEAGGLSQMAKPGRLFRRSLLVALGNPKGYLFFAALLPQFLDPGQALGPQYVTLALIFALIDLGVMAAYAALGSRAMRLMQRHGTLWLDRGCGGVLLALAALLALYRRAEA